jgi:hypothetical protein
MEPFVRSFIRVTVCAEGLRLLAFQPPNRDVLLLAGEAQGRREFRAGYAEPFTGGADLGWGQGTTRSHVLTFLV